MAGVLIIGGPGSGKTTLGHLLANSLDLTLTELDAIGYETGAGQKRALSEKLIDIARIAETEQWVADGIFLGWTDRLFERSTAIIWLDVPWRVAGWRIVSRHVKASLAKNKKHAGLGNLRFFLQSARRYYVGEMVARSPIDDDGAVTRAETEHELRAWTGKVLRCGSNANLLSILESIYIAGQAATSST